jgi:cell division control protein 45
LHTLILLNMGGILDLTTEEWFGAFPAKLSVHVVDSTRPQNLGNLFAAGDTADRIIIWDDGEVERLQEEKTAWEALTVRMFRLLRLNM